LVFAGLISNVTRSGLVQYQKLDDLSSEFDPFTDADSNYGRVLSIQALSRTNGPVSEDMDMNGEYKGRVQQLYEMAPQFKDHKASGKAPLPEAGPAGTDMSFLAHSGAFKIGSPDSQFQDRPATGVAPLAEAGTVGTDASFLQTKSNKAGNWYEGVEKSRVQMLYSAPPQFKEKAPVSFQKLPDAGVVGTDASFLRSKSNKAGQWYEGREKAPVQMLARPLRFQPKHSQYQALPDAGAMGTNKAFIGKSDGSGQSTKAPLQQLFEVTKFEDQTPATVEKLPDAGVVGTDASFLQSKSNKAGQWYEGMEKAPVQMLARPLRFQPKHRQYQALPDAGAMGTNKAFIGKADGSGQSTKAPLQQLFDIDGPQPTDPRYASWVQSAGRHSDGTPYTKQETLAAKIRAGLPNQ